jgi:hypothetical protein
MASYMLWRANTMLVEDCRADAASPADKGTQAASPVHCLIDALYMCIIAYSLSFQHDRRNGLTQPAKGTANHTREMLHLVNTWLSMFCSILSTAGRIASARLTVSQEAAYIGAPVLHLSCD